MTPINRAWHEAHQMPTNPTDDQRIAWHVEHVQHCPCRPIPPGVVALMDARGLEVPVGVVPSRADGEVRP